MQIIQLICKRGRDVIRPLLRDFLSYINNFPQETINNTVEKKKIILHLYACLAPLCSPVGYLFILFYFFNQILKT